MFTRAQDFEEQVPIEPRAEATAPMPDTQQHLMNMWREYMGIEVEPEFVDLVRRLEKIEGIRPEEWERLSLKEREQVLVQIHREMAKTYHFPEAKVEIAHMPARVKGMFSKDDNLIEINRSLLEKKDPTEAIETMLHESRHAYQFYTIKQPLWKIPEERRQEVMKWRENWQH